MYIRHMQIPCIYFTMYPGVSTASPTPNVHSGGCNGKPGETISWKPGVKFSWTVRDFCWIYTMCGPQTIAHPANFFFQFHSGLWYAKNHRIHEFINQILAFGGPTQCMSVFVVLWWMKNDAIMAPNTSYKWFYVVPTEVIESINGAMSVVQPGFWGPCQMSFPLRLNSEIFWAGRNPSRDQGCFTERHGNFRTNVVKTIWLVVWNIIFFSPYILGISSSQLTFFFFFRGVQTTNQNHKPNVTNIIDRHGVV